MEYNLDPHTVRWMVEHIIAPLNRYSFFKGRDMEDWIPFLVSWCSQFGVYFIPRGSGWAGNATKEQVEEYLSDERIQKLFDEYHQWYVEQR